MAAGSSVIIRMVANSVCVSHRAGLIIRDIMSKGDLGTVTKGKMDFQTEADRSGQKCIMASLHKSFPKASLFGEEDLDPRDCQQVNPDWVETSLDPEVMSYADKLPEDLKTVKEEDVVVWIDPLDGTAEYTQGGQSQRLLQYARHSSNGATRILGSQLGLSLLDHVTVLIGICVGGKAVGGVMYQPYFNYQAGPEAKLGRAIWGIPGLGSFGYSPTLPPEGQNIITTTRSHSNRTVVDSVDACEPSEILRAGGAGHKVLLILEGKAHAYVFGSPGCKKWDTAAPEAILNAAGGLLTDIHGNVLPYHHNCQRRNTSGVLAVPKREWHQWYLERIPQHVKDALPFQP